MNKVVVGISGGIDSAVTAAIYKQKGYEVLGLHLQVTPREVNPEGLLEKISYKLRIPITTLDVSAEFNATIIGYFRQEHLNGNSPSLCAVCNPEFKWKYLNNFAEQHNARRIASGHYIQKELFNGRWYIKKGIDPNKDQSYFLWGLSQDIIEKFDTPLGEINKDETRLLAAELDLDFLTKKKESSGLCFAGGLSYPELINKYIPEAKHITEGNITTPDGHIIGKHKGFIYYTIGQKRDLQLFDKNRKLCVTGIDAKNNVLIAGEPEDLWQNEFNIKDYVFVDIDYALHCNKLEVKVRGFGWNPDGYGKLLVNQNGTITVKLDNPAWALAPGQPAVFYHKNLLLGGGIVC